MLSWATVVSLLGSEDNARTLVSLISAYPLGWIHTKIPNSHPDSKHFFSLFFGLLILHFIYGWSGLLTSLATATLNYAWLAWMRSGTMPARLQKRAHYVSLFFNFFLLFGWHLYRMYVSYMIWTLDVSSVLMLQTLRSIALAFDLYDGTQPYESLTEHQKKCRLTRLPSPLVYYGFQFFFGSVLVGPVVELGQYMALTKVPPPATAAGAKAAAVQTPDEQAAATSHSIPMVVETLPLPPEGLTAYRWVPALTRAILGLGGLALYSFCQQLHISEALKPEFDKHCLPYKLVFVCVSFFVFRCKYYGGWALAEGSCIVAGLGYDPEKRSCAPVFLLAPTDHLAGGMVAACDVHPEFGLPGDRVRMLPRDVTNFWNVMVTRWFRFYCYERGPVDQRGRIRGYMVHVTMVLSGFWHGFYPGYHFCFFTSALLLSLYRGLYRRLKHLTPVHPSARPAGRPYFVQAALYYGVWAVCVTMTFLNVCYTAFIPFELMSFERLWHVYGVYRYYGYYLLAATALFNWLVPIPKAPKGPKEAPASVAAKTD
ncbi:putative membrane bound O-acyl transferase family protein [Paratrimastix pyriformis]|uniref:Membrane bound O-acyl transferase family protein n=1 Tax=Paratrimastix pyriformis TaxID=342808 RepID=A0ABQ8ULN4_9EUKA|nr:putative membrane bound O-acyl transferase family protein [Paratrimastix pyriformis]